VTKAAEKLLTDALELALPERAELLASLDGAPDFDAGAAWAVEIDRRAERARSGADAGQVWTDARDRIQGELRKR
jgi:hypothetical protein